jgi:hypothetical protein
VGHWVNGSAGRQGTSFAEPQRGAKFARRSARRRTWAARMQVMGRAREVGSLAKGSPFGCIEDKEGGMRGMGGGAHPRFTVGYRLLIRKGERVPEEAEKNGSYSSLNSQEVPILTQLPPATAWEIRSARTRVCRHVARGQECPANLMRRSCGRLAARTCASPRPYPESKRERAPME